MQYLLELISADLMPLHCFGIWFRGLHVKRGRCKNKIGGVAPRNIIVSGGWVFFIFKKKFCDDKVHFLKYIYL